MRYKKIITVLFVLIIVSTPIVVSATSIAELQARVQSLIVLVAQLQQRVASGYGSITPTTQSPWWCSVYSDVSYGQYNNRVMALHQAMGYNILGTYPTGYYGRLTYAAWSRYCEPRVTPPIIYPTINTPPSISSFSGPTTLAINQVGTWTVHASDRENGQLTYSITWGDEALHRYAVGANMPITDSFVQSTSFTHQYSQAGIYTVNIVVRDNTGQEARTTTTVRVDNNNTICTLEYNPVCGQPPMPQCPAGMLCTLAMPAPQTYGNTCQLNATGATLLYYGVCSSVYY